MKKTGLLVLICALGLGGFFLFRGGGEDLSTEVEMGEGDDAGDQEIIRGPVEQIETYIIQDGDVFTSVCDELGIGYGDALVIVENAEEIFDFTNVRVGKEIRLVSLAGEKLRLEYEPNKEDVVVVDLADLEFPTRMEKIAYDITIETAAVTIEESLYASALAAGIEETLVLDFAEVFAWEIDFATQVQKGDAFYAVYEKRWRDGEAAGTGDVLKGSFTNMGHTDYAYRYVDPDGFESYYDEDGNSMIRQFLKAPLSYSRITSGFTYARYHPVLNTTTPHRAIDYAAPTGTPIMAVADGTVTRASWNGGYGNHISVRHNGMYDTTYSHLSRYAVGAGQHVSQGEIIGYVGSTGYSTGPHLHYEVLVYGEKVNPLEVDFPEGDPIPEEEMALFYAQKADIDALD